VNEGLEWLGTLQPAPGREAELRFASSGCWRPGGGNPPSLGPVRAAEWPAGSDGLDGAGEASRCTPAVLQVQADAGGPRGCTANGCRDGGPAGSGRPGGEPFTLKVAPSCKFGLSPQPLAAAGSRCCVLSSLVSSSSAGPRFQPRISRRTTATWQSRNRSQPYHNPACRGQVFFATPNAQSRPEPDRGSRAQGPAVDGSRWVSPLPYGNFIVNTGDGQGLAYLVCMLVAGGRRRAASQPRIDLRP